MVGFVDHMEQVVVKNTFINVVENEGLDGEGANRPRSKTEPVELLIDFALEAAAQPLDEDMIKRQLSWEVPQTPESDSEGEAQSFGVPDAPDLDILRLSEQLQSLCQENVYLTEQLARSSAGYQHNVQVQTIPQVWMPMVLPPVNMFSVAGQVQDSVEPIIASRTVTMGSAEDESSESSEHEAAVFSAELPASPPKKVRGKHEGILESERTTVMLRNLPNNYTRDMVLSLLNDEGFFGKYDFFYLPIDFNSKASLGYAFVNLVDAAAAREFRDTFEGFTKWVIPSKKKASVGWSGPYQGLKAHIQRYRSSPVMHSSVPDECKPVVFENGIRVPFPMSGKAPRKPRHARCMAPKATGLQHSSRKVPAANH